MLQLHAGALVCTIESVSAQMATSVAAVR